MPTDTSPASPRPAIVVTGASSGIGREIARVAAKEGDALVLVGRSRSSLDALVAELGGAGAVCTALCLDLQKPEACRAVAQELEQRGLYCDVLVNSAGYGVFGPAAVHDAQDQLGVLDVNARALTELSLRFLPGMMVRKRGGILNVGSMTGFVAGPNMAVYYATKAYVHSLSNALAMEAVGSGVTVTCLTPGVVRTEFFERCDVGTTRISKLYPRMDADVVAKAGWRAFRQGRRMIIPGGANKVIAALLRLTPEVVTLNVLRVLQSRP